MTFSLRARVVFPVDRPAIEHGVVTIDGERIVSVGTRAKGGEVDDLGSVALLPGLVNAHTHLEFSHLERPLGRAGMPLAEWIRLVIAERGRRDVDVEASIAAGLAESVRSGVTTLGEIATAGAGAYAASPIELSAFLEVIGFSQARAESAFAALLERFEGLPRLLRAKPQAAHVRLGVSPHGPYTVSRELLTRLVGWASDQRLPVAMHLAESAEELEFLDRGTGPFQVLLEERSMWDEAAVPRGSRPLDYLRLLAEAPRALVIHGNYLDDEERAFLARHAERMSLVYCPRTHAYFGHPRYPLDELQSRGVRLALGTDSRASNPDLDLLAEMRQVAREFPALRRQAILRMGTLAGAEALGCADEVGSITAGKLANLIAVPLPETAGEDAEELLAALLAADGGPSAVWVRGQLVDR